MRHFVFVLESESSRMSLLLYCHRYIYFANANARENFYCELFSKCNRMHLVDAGRMGTVISLAERAVGEDIDGLWIKGQDTDGGWIPDDESDPDVQELLVSLVVQSDHCGRRKPTNF